MQIFINKKMSKKKNKNNILIKKYFIFYNINYICINIKKTKTKKLIFN